jgi:hypothetical protein
MAPDAVELTASTSQSEKSKKEEANKKKEELEDALSEEDKQLKERLETCVYHDYQ